MIPRIKVSILALVAIAAIGAVSAAAAQAGVFRVEKFPATMTGSQVTEHVFIFSMFSIACKVARFHGDCPPRPAN